MFQYKLIHALDDSAVSQVKERFNQDDIYFFTNDIIGIKYSLKLNTYTDVLKKLIDINVKQWTLTSSRFKNIMNLAFEENLFLGTIEFIDNIDENINVDYINKYIFQINNLKNKNDKINITSRFFNELDWIMLEDCIDIKSIKLKISIDEYPFESEIRFFNNGVVYIDSEKVLSRINKMFLRLI